MNKIILFLAFLTMIACGENKTSSTSGPLANNTGSVAAQSAEEQPATSTEIVVDESATATKEERMKKVSKGNKITNAKYADHSGIESSFDNLKGKTVVIDLWATWCTPCLDAMPAYDKLAAANSSDQDLVFMKLSIDEDKKYWADYVTKNNHGSNSNWIGRDESNQLFWLSYKNIEYEGKELVLESLPRYVIIGPDGTVLDNDAPSPLTGDLKEAITSLNI